MAGTTTSNLINALATVNQLDVSNSQNDGVAQELEQSILFVARQWMQVAGVLLRAPQDVIAKAIVIFSRCWLGESGLSLLHYDAMSIAAACMYLSTKLSGPPQSPRSIINTYAYLQSFDSAFLDDRVLEQNSPDKYFVPESRYYSERETLFKNEAQILYLHGYDLHVALPHPLAISYLQALDAVQGAEGQKLVQKVMQLLNTLLIGPQLLYLTHQPNELATAAIYLAAREAGVRLPQVPWWEVFDTDREQLGFVCVGILSAAGFAEAEAEKWKEKKLPISKKALSDVIANDTSNAA